MTLTPRAVTVCQALRNGEFEVLCESNEFLWHCKISFCLNIKLTISQREQILFVKLSNTYMLMQNSLLSTTIVSNIKSNRLYKLRVRMYSTKIELQYFKINKLSILWNVENVTL